MADDKPNLSLSCSSTPCGTCCCGTIIDVSPSGTVYSGTLLTVIATPVTQMANGKVVAIDLETGNPIMGDARSFRIGMTVVPIGLTNPSSAVISSISGNTLMLASPLAGAGPSRTLVGTPSPMATEGLLLITQWSATPDITIAPSSWAQQEDGTWKGTLVANNPADREQILNISVRDAQKGFCGAATVNVSADAPVPADIALEDRVPLLIAGYTDDYFALPSNYTSSPSPGYWVVGPGGTSGTQTWLWDGCFDWMNGYPAEAMRMGVKPGAAGCWCMFGGNYPIFKEGKLISWDQRAGDWSCFVYLGNDDYWHIYMFGRVYNGDDSRWVSIWKGKKTSGAHPSGTFTRLSGDDGGTDTRPYVALNEIAQVATPTFSPAEGYYESSVEITLACATSGATIHYCLDDNDVCPEHQAYSGPLVFESGTSGNWVLLKFRAFKSGMGGSTQVVAYFEIYPPPPADPTFSPDGGSFVGSVDVTITPGDSSDYVNWWTDSGPSGGGTGPQVATLTASDTLYADTHNGSFYYGHHEAAYTIT